MAEDQLERQLAAARRVTPSYGPARQQQLIWQVRRRLSERVKFVRTARVTALGAVALAAGLAFAVPRLLHPKLAPVARSANGTALELPDGSEITPDTALTVLHQTLDTPSEADFELTAGAAAFEVTPLRTRAFLVHSGGVTVRVTGTRFRVAHHDDKTEVSVQRGSVLVSWSGGSQALGVGEAGVFPPDAAPVASVDTSLVAGSTSEDATRAAANLALAPAGVAVTAESLFASADRERGAGQPARAELELKTLIERFPRDPRAPLAAFTRGRLLLESLGRPRDAAAAFARARAGSAVKSALAEDALAREVDALRAAGDMSLAAQRAALYLKLYPNGLRRAQMSSGDQ
ncbi:MAG TPA: FecR family protein [Polyangiaceae bacterium]|jgi:transmembrane sensor